MGWDEVAAQSVGVLSVMSGIVAVSLGGSVAVGLADEASDLDLHVYWADPCHRQKREQRACAP